MFLDKIKRKKQVSKQDITKPKTVDDLIRKYDLENVDIYNYLDYLVDNLNNAANIYEFKKNIYIEEANTWYDTGIIGSDLQNSGVYAMEMYTNCYDVSRQYHERLGGIVSWHAESTNGSNYDEIPLSKSGHARNNHDIKLRILRQANTVSPNVIKLQISDTVAWTGSGEVMFKFRKLL